MVKVVAAPFGLVDWLAIRQARAQSVSAWRTRSERGGARLVRRRARVAWQSPSRRSLPLAGVGGVRVSGVTAWLGGELINRHGIGVHDLIGEDVPSSLSRRPLMDLERRHAAMTVEG